MYLCVFSNTKKKNAPYSIFSPVLLLTTNPYPKILQLKTLNPNPQLPPIHPHHISQPKVQSIGHQRMPYAHLQKVFNI